MESFIDFFGDIDNITSLIINSITAAFVTILLIVLLRPRLKIVDICKDVVNKKNGNLMPVIKFTIKNKGFFTATNINCEACFIKDGFTYHLDFERDTFILIPGRDFSKVYERTFKAYAISRDTELAMRETPISFLDFLNEYIKNPVRVRVFSNHGLTGFGRTTERNFDEVSITK